MSTLHNTIRYYKNMGLVVACVALVASGCSAVLDTDALQEGSDDAAPYDVSASYKGMRAMPAQTLALASEGDFAFHWAPLPGQPNGCDLSLQVGKGVALQVFARDGKPFARLGLSVVPLKAHDTYRVSYRRDGKELRLSLHRGEKILSRHTLSAGRLGLLIAPAPVGGSRVMHVALGSQPTHLPAVALFRP
ncbi:MAG: hypothetical protein JRH20_13650 [Deltaproteobacteria bacterium]|nr:hypothetical protein [Deltaproteobacteria bacterium]